MSSTWHYLENGNQRGPVSQEGIFVKLDEGVLNSQSLVWREGQADWLPIASVPELNRPAVKSVSELATENAKYSKAGGPDTIDRMIGAAMKFALLLVVIGICVGGWFYIQHLNTPKGPTYSWISDKFSRVTAESLNVSGNDIPNGRWIPVRVSGGDNYEVKMSFHAAEIDQYVSTGEHDIPEGVDVFVWEVHRVIERRSDSGQLHGAANKEEFHREVHFWSPLEPAKDGSVQGYQMKALPFREKS